MGGRNARLTSLRGPERSFGVQAEHLQEDAEHVAEFGAVGAGGVEDGPAALVADGKADPDRVAMAAFTRVLLGSNEFLTVD